MAKYVLHPSIEGAQHGAKSLDDFLTFAKESGATGAQPSNFIIEKDNSFYSAQEIRDLFNKHNLKMDGISNHCIMWVHTTAWTESKTIRPFLPSDIWGKSPSAIEMWCEDYILKFFDLSAELGLKIIPMFWGMSCGFELGSGYPFGFFKGSGYDLEQEALERFVTKTAKIRARANELGLYLCHEIHPNSAAMCADDFNALVSACDQDRCLGVTADPSHCWEGEEPETRFRKVADRIYSAAWKNFVIRKGVPLRKMSGDWTKRGMQFVDLASGEMNLIRYTELMINLGYPERYCKVMGTETAPLVTEAESVYRSLDATSANAIAYASDKLCFPVAEGSFEDGMGVE